MAYKILRKYERTVDSLPIVSYYHRMRRLTSDEFLELYAKKTGRPAKPEANALGWLLTLHQAAQGDAHRVAADLAVLITRLRPFDGEDQTFAVNAASRLLEMNGWMLVPDPLIDDLVWQANLNLVSINTVADTLRALSVPE